jgi:hypothetical protein
VTRLALEPLWVVVVVLSGPVVTATLAVLLHLTGRRLKRQIDLLAEYLRESETRT